MSNVIVEFQNPNGPIQIVEIVDTDVLDGTNENPTEANILGHLDLAIRSNTKSGYMSKTTYKNYRDLSRSKQGLVISPPCKVDDHIVITVD